MNTRRSVTLAAIVVAAAVATPLVSASPAQATVSQDGCKLTALKPQFLNHCFRTHTEFGASEGASLPRLVTPVSPKSHV